MYRGGPGPDRRPPVRLDRSEPARWHAHAIQRALDAAAAAPRALVVVYPNTPSLFNPFGSYFENIIIHSPVKLQGVGPGGLAWPTARYVPGTVLDGLGYGTDGARETAWQATAGRDRRHDHRARTTLPLDPATVAPPEGEVILAVATSTTQYGSGLQGGDRRPDGPERRRDGLRAERQHAWATARRSAAATTRRPTRTRAAASSAFASTRFLQITNNIIKSNAGAYAGAIRLGTPLVGDNHLDGAHIANNRILNNGGTNLAGAVGIFNGAYGYEINNNDLCGNFSAEYGGGISHFGLDGSLHGQRQPLDDRTAHRRASTTTASTSTARTTKAAA